MLDDSKDFPLFNLPSIFLKTIPLHDRKHGPTPSSSTPRSLFLLKTSLSIAIALTIPLMGSPSSWTRHLSQSESNSIYVSSTINSPLRSTWNHGSTMRRGSKQAHKSRLCASLHLADAAFDCDWPVTFASRFIEFSVRVGGRGTPERFSPELFPI